MAEPFAWPFQPRSGSSGFSNTNNCICTMQKSFIKLVALAAVALGLITQSIAQVITTSPLNGTVLNEQGQPVANAAVTVVHEPTSSTYSATSRADGTFVVRGLRPGGPYTVTSRADGFSPAETREVYLDIDVGATISQRLRSDVVQLEAFSVTASAADQLFDPSQTGSGSYLTARDIRDLPGGDRSINSLARLDPRISYNRDPQDRAISAGGASNRYNSIQVDGVSASDPFGLNANNTAAERNVIPLDSLEALAINTSPYYSRNGGFVGAQINAITKSGTNEFKGSAYYTYRGRSVSGYDLVADTLDNVARPIASFNEETFGVTLGGPIIPKRLFFYIANEMVREDRIPPNPIAPVDPTIVSQITAGATALGFTPGNPTPTSNRLEDDNILAKLDWQINANHRATFRYNDVKSSRPTFPGFGSGISENNFSYSSSWFQQEIQNTTYFGQLISRWSDKLNTEISVSRSTYDSKPTNSSRQPYLQIRNVPAIGSSNTAFITLGTENSRHANVLKVETDTAELFASYELADNHTLQAGLQYESADVYNLFVQNAYGFYDFNNLAQFLAVVANNTGTVNYRTYTYNQILSGVEPAAEFSEGNMGLFVNDQWRVSPNLRIDLGARIDMAKLPDAVPFNQTFSNTFGVRNDSTYDGKKVIQPRVGFNWQPEFDDKRTVIRGGVGLFYGKAPRVWISNSYSNTGMNFRTWTAGTTPAGTAATQAPAVSPNPDAQPTVGNNIQQVAFMDPNFELPSKWKANLAIERELAFWDLKATAEIEQTYTDKDVFYTNINLNPTRTGPDGRQLYYSTYSASSSGTSLVSSLFTNRTMKIGNTSKGEGRTVILSVERPRKKDGWYWRASYVNTNAEEVLYGTSSVAASNWNNRSIFNANGEEVARASLEIKHKFLVNVTKDFELIDGYRTTASILYEGRSGYPFSFVFSGDTNGDSQTQNDLLYVPSRSGDTRVRFATPTDQERFYAIVDRFGLQEGAAVSANSHRYPWVNQFDFSLKQEIKLPAWRHRLVLGADILNVGNLLNSKWGLIRGSNQFFVKREQVAAAAFDATANGGTGQYVYSNVSSFLASGADFNPSLGRGEPAATRWSVLFSARYEF
ncbi:MAG: hypothetical protein C0518_15475 [Opitutus sp.]|nr:hypothetical protein [Opitutus sp.]